MYFQVKSYILHEFNRFWLFNTVKEIFFITKKNKFAVETDE